MILGEYALKADFAVSGQINICTVVYVRIKICKIKDTQIVGSIYVK